MALSCAGCGPARGGEQQYILIHRSAAAALPIAVEIEEMYGSCDHFITHYGMNASGTNTWNTEVFFGNRYSLTMQVPVMIDYGANKVKVAGDPIFYMHEYTKIDPTGGASVGENYEFSGNDWRKVVKANGNYSVLGMTLNPKPVDNFDKLVEATRRPRIPISLTKP